MDVENDFFRFFDLPDVVIRKVLQDHLSTSTKAHVLHVLPEFARLLDQRCYWRDQRTFDFFRLSLLVPKPGFYTNKVFPHHLYRISADEQTRTCKVSHFGIGPAVSPPTTPTTTAADGIDAAAAAPRSKIQTTTFRDLEGSWQRFQDKTVPLTSDDYEEEEEEEEEEDSTNYSVFECTCRFFLLCPFKRVLVDPKRKTVRWGAKYGNRFRLGREESVGGGGGGGFFQFFRKGRCRYVATMARGGGDDEETNTDLVFSCSSKGSCPCCLLKQHSFRRVKTDWSTSCITMSADDADGQSVARVVANAYGIHDYADWQFVARTMVCQI